MPRWIPSRPGHSERVQLIGKDLGRPKLGCSDEAELEALEWGGLLHDIGKIGIPKLEFCSRQGALTKEERVAMNAHPVKGEEIIRRLRGSRRSCRSFAITTMVQRLRLSGPAHWSRDPEAGAHPPRCRRVRGDDRRPPLSDDAAYSEQALNELRKFAGIQFDPVVVDAFVKTHYVEDVPDAGRHAQLRPIPLLGQAAATMVGGPRPEGPAPVEQA